MKKFGAQEAALSGVGLAAIAAVAFTLLVPEAALADTVSGTESVPLRPSVDPSGFDFVGQFDAKMASTDDVQMGLLEQMGERGPASGCPVTRFEAVYAGIDEQQARLQTVFDALAEARAAQDQEAIVALQEEYKRTVQKIDFGIVQLSLMANAPGKCL